MKAEVVFQPKENPQLGVNLIAEDRTDKDCLEYMMQHDIVLKPAVSRLHARSVLPYELLFHSFRVNKIFHDLDGDKEATLVGRTW